ncbi:MAG: nicotinate (nicotinamide) nucleotide adenylyltransferase [Deltaproteobacteria bacterium]|jgi:nicotinate-nucleotide adenylyltransferase|nr:nicotinate (nicotinamide) nucleotide adenylyltransferase [Deltaproteobacteria bacterium]
MTLRVGLFGGTFDPVHFGHLRAAEELAIHLKLTEILFIPAALHPHKMINGPIDFKHRLAMLKLAISDRPGFSVTDIEASLPKPSYTVNTVAALKKTIKGDLIFLVGYDSFRHIQKWTHYRELLALTPTAVFRRPGTAGGLTALQTVLVKALEETPVWDDKLGAFQLKNSQPIHYYEGCQLSISSTDLRARLAAGDSVRYLLPEKVRAYLVRRSLYSPQQLRS